MFKTQIDQVGKAAQNKVGLLRRDPLSYFLLSMLAGMYIGFGILLAFTVSGQLNGASVTKLAMGAVFGVALSLVVIAGGELFTGSNFVLSVGLMTKKVSWTETLYLWLICWLGNACGSIVLALLYHATGLQVKGVATAMATTAVAKMSATPTQLLTRAILCNILVCLAIWMTFQTKSDAAKLIMVFWCLLAFFTSGFEHSVANMTLLTAALLEPVGNAVSVVGWGYNLLWVTLGNMLGAIIFLALPYTLATRK